MNGRNDETAKMAAGQLPYTRRAMLDLTLDRVKAIAAAEQAEAAIKLALTGDSMAEAMIHSALAKRRARELDAMWQRAIDWLDSNGGELPPETPWEMNAGTRAALSELPVFKSHKLVKAASIIAISEEGIGLGDDSGDILESISMAELPPDIFARGTPEVGDYLVFYDNDYVSWSPMGAFEAGYARHGAS